MDPKIYGKLPTHHRRGNVVDEEALRVRIPPPTGHQNVPQMGSCGDRSLRRRKSDCDDLLIFSGIYGIICAKDLGQGAAREATSLPIAASTPGGGVWACVLPGAHLAWPKSPLVFFRSGKIISGFFFRLDSVPKSDLKRVENTEKTGTGTWH